VNDRQKVACLTIILVASTLNFDNQFLVLNQLLLSHSHGELSRGLRTWSCYG
jgi:hypothetical protein